MYETEKCRSIEKIENKIDVLNAEWKKKFLYFQIGRYGMCWCIKAYQHTMIYIWMNEKTRVNVIRNTFDIALIIEKNAKPIFSRKSLEQIQFQAEILYFFKKNVLLLSISWVHWIWRWIRSMRIWHVWAIFRVQTTHSAIHSFLS